MNADISMQKVNNLNNVTIQKFNMFQSGLIFASLVILQNILSSFHVWFWCTYNKPVH